MPDRMLELVSPSKAFVEVSPSSPHGHHPDQIPFNKDRQNGRFCWPTSQLILMLGILIGGRFRASTWPTWNFLIWKQQNLHIKENDQHQLLPNKLVTPLLLFCLSLLWPWWCPSSSGGHRAVRCNQDLVEVKGWGWHVVKGVTSFGAVAFCVSSCLFILFACSAVQLAS